MDLRGICNKKIFAAVWISAAIAIALLSEPRIAEFFRWRDFKKTAPPFFVLATSPAATELLHEISAAGIETKTARVEKNNGNKKLENSIHIPKINAFVPIVAGGTSDIVQLRKLLDSGAVIYPGSAGFGNIGQTVLLGHSAPVNWPDVKHDTAFSHLSELVLGDSIHVNYGDRTFNYTITRKQVIDKGGDFTGAPVLGSAIIIITCWPPGRDLQRLAVEAVLLDKQ